MAIIPVELIKSYRLLNHGPTTLISAKHNGVENVMSASWVGLVDLMPPCVSLIIGKGNFTRHLLENSGYFAVQVPVAAQAKLVLDMGESAIRILINSIKSSCFIKTVLMCRWLPVAPLG